MGADCKSVAKASKVRILHLPPVLKYVGERYVEDGHGDVDREGQVRGYIDAIEVPTSAGSSSVVLRRAASIRVRLRRAGWPSRREHL